MFSQSITYVLFVQFCNSFAFGKGKEKDNRNLEVHKFCEQKEDTEAMCIKFFCEPYKLFLGTIAYVNAKNCRQYLVQPMENIIPRHILSHIVWQNVEQNI